MEKVLNQLVDGVASGNALAIAVIVVVAIVFNFEKIFSFLDARKKVKINLIEESLNNPHVSGNTKQYLERLIEEEYFKSITGIYLEKEIREALIEAHQKSNGELKFKHFKRSIPYITYKEGVLSIEINLFSKVGFVYNLLFGLLSTIAGIVFFVLPAFVVDIEITKILPIYGVALFMVSFGLVMLKQSVPMISVKHVQKILDRIHNKSIHPTADASAD